MGRLVGLFVGFGVGDLLGLNMGEAVRTFETPHPSKISIQKFDKLVNLDALTQ